MGGLTASPHTSSHEMFALRVTAAVSVQPDQTGPGAVLRLCGPERRRLTSCMAAALALPRVLQGAPTHLDRKLAFWLGHCCVWH